MKDQTIHMQQESVRKFNQSRICDLLQWSQSQLTWFIYNNGIRFMEEYFDHDEKAIDQLKTRREFWKWWKVLWNGRDAAYLEDLDGREDEIVLKIREILYNKMHNIKMLASEIYPPRHIYPKGFTHIKIEMK